MAKNPPKRIRPKRRIDKSGETGVGQRAQRDEQGLTPHQAAFVREYLLCNVGAEAVRRVSPKSKYPNVQAQEWLKLPHIMAAVEAGRALSAKRARMTLDDVVAGLEDIARGNLDDFMTTDPKTGRKYIDWVKIDALPDEERRAKMAAIGEVTVETIGGGSRGKPVVVGTKLKMLDRKGALVDLGKHLGGFVQRGELTGKNGGPLQHSVVQANYKLPEDPLEATRAYQDLVKGIVRE